MEEGLLLFFFSTVLFDEYENVFIHLLHIRTVPIATVASLFGIYQYVLVNGKTLSINIRFS